MTVTTLMKLLSQTFEMSVSVTVIFDLNPTVWPMDFVFIIEHTSYNHFLLLDTVYGYVKIRPLTQDFPHVPVKSNSTTYHLQWTIIVTGYRL